MKIFFELINFLTLDNSFKNFVFYSEGKHNWPHLKGLIKELIRLENKVTILTSDINDPCFREKHKNLVTFYIGMGHFRSWLFKNLDVNILITTTPDIETYQLKRSRYNVHYVYVQHSLISLHMGYRHGAFNHFDSIFCSGVHHIKEMKEIEKLYKLKKKQLYEHGYSRIDNLIKNNKTKKYNYQKVKNILIAPTWGSKGLIESKSIEIILKKLNKKELNIFLRPHPETWKRKEEYINDLSKNNIFNFVIDKTIDNDELLMKCDILITDWSGIGFEFALGLKKPVIFLDIEKKINNKDYYKFKIKPYEIKMRKKLGLVMKIKDLDEKKLNFRCPKFKLDEHIFLNADLNGARSLIKINESIKNVNK